MSRELECLEALEQDIKDRVVFAEGRQLKLCAVIKQALIELQTIKEAQPNEAIECLKEIEKRCKTDYEYNITWYDYEKELSTIKRALLKAEALEEENNILLGQNEDLYDELMLADKQHREFSHFAVQQNKVLKIIKEKCVFIYAIRACEKVDKYNEYVTKLFDFKLDKLLTQEEFKLLKEMFE